LIDWLIDWMLCIGHDRRFGEGGCVDRSRCPRPGSHGSNVVLPGQRRSSARSALQRRVSASCDLLITTSISLRFDGRSTAYQRSLRSQWCNPLAALTLTCLFIMPPPLIGGALSDGFVWRLSDVWRLSVGPNSRTERPRKTNIGTRDSDTTFKVKRSKVKVTRPLYSARP